MILFLLIILSLFGCSAPSNEILDLGVDNSISKKVVLSTDTLNWETDKQSGCVFIRGINSFEFSRDCSDEDNEQNVRGYCTKEFEFEAPFDLNTFSIVEVHSLSQMFTVMVTRLPIPPGEDTPYLRDMAFTFIGTSRYGSRLSRTVLPLEKGDKINVALTFHTKCTVNNTEDWMQVNSMAFSNERYD